MPWKVAPVSELRIALVHYVRTQHHTVADAAREFGVSRKTAHKWLAVYDDQPQQPLLDRSRRPQRSPQKTADAIEALVVDIRQRFNWGPRKIHAYLQSPQHTLPSIRTIASILKRSGCIDPPPTPSTAQVLGSGSTWEPAGTAVDQGRERFADVGGAGLAQHCE